MLYALFSYVLTSLINSYIGDLKALIYRRSKLNKTSQCTLEDTNYKLTARQK